MKCLVAAFATACLFASVSCRGNEPPTGREQNLLVAGAEDSDTLEAHLIHSQRQLIRALATDDSAAVTRLVSTRFVAHDTREGEPVPVSVAGAERPRQITWLEVVSGSLQGRVDAEYSAFHVTADGDQATIYALGSTEALRTTWRRSEAGWSATQLIFLRTHDARQMIEALEE